MQDMSEMNNTRKINMFCLPFAGGSSYSLNGLQRYTADFINIVLVELPGRGKRIREPLLTDMHEMTDDIFHRIKKYMNEPYAIYGHSMGATLGYLVAQKIDREKMQKPVHLFFTGRQGPSVENREKGAYLLPKQIFIQRLKEYEGIPDEILREDDFMDFFEPILRADFQAIGTYIYNNAAPLDIPITVIIGMNDNTTYEEALTWQEVTTRKTTVRQFPGGHFFIFDEMPELGGIISQSLWNAVEMV